MTDDTSPWPEGRRGQGLLAGAGVVLLVSVALALGGVLGLSDTTVVGVTTAAAALLIYGLLGWAARRVEGAAAAGVDEEPPE